MTPEEYAELNGAYPDAPNNPTPSTTGFMDNGGFAWAGKNAESFNTDGWDSYTVAYIEEEDDTQEIDDDYEDLNEAMSAYQYFINQGCEEVVIKGYTMNENGDFEADSKPVAEYSKGAYDNRPQGYGAESFEHDAMCGHPNEVDCTDCGNVLCFDCTGVHLFNETWTDENGTFTNKLELCNKCYTHRNKYGAESLGIDEMDCPDCGHPSLEFPTNQRLHCGNCGTDFYDAEIEDVSESTAVITNKYNDMVGVVEVDDDDDDDELVEVSIQDENMNEVGSYTLDDGVLDEHIYSMMAEGKCQNSHTGKYGNHNWMGGPVKENSLLNDYETVYGQFGIYCDGCEQEAYVSFDMPTKKFIEVCQTPYTSQFKDFDLRGAEYTGGLLDDGEDYITTDHKNVYGQVNFTQETHKGTREHANTAHFTMSVGEFLKRNKKYIKIERDVYGAESAFDRLEDEVADEYEEKGMSDEKAQKIGAAVAYTQGVKKYGKKVMTEAAKKGVSAKSLTKNAESLVEEPDWIPDGDGRAFGQQNSAINLSPLHAESQRDSFRAKSNVITIWGVDYDTRIDEYNNTIIEDCGTSILAELEVKTRFDEDYEGLYDRDNEFVYVDYDKNTQECTFSTTDFDVIVELIDDNHVAIEEIGYEALGRKRWKAESQESMILEACGICDKDFASETLNADGYCGSCCDSRLAEFDNRIDFSAETDDEPYYCMDCDDRQKLPVEEMCPKCLTEGQFYCWECCSRNEGDAHFSAESKGISKNAQIALGLTALGVGIAVWKSNDILNLFNKFRGE